MGKRGLHEVIRTRDNATKNGNETYKGRMMAWSEETVRSVTNEADGEIGLLKEVGGHRVEATSFRRATSEQYRERGFHQSCHR